ncbi:ECF transporter S component [Bacillus massilinigeriensis]|uniref:ECF transporter S component n=1 Tax=Bacillus mediterraneensis TaxID=1805474 RepID=UPI0008F82C2C|nr:ECF transporter S component [Bacillus mediterraneensis]
MTNKNLRRLILISLFSALSVIGGFIKVPSPVGSIALDSFPALLAAAILGPLAGTAVGGIGHLLSALSGGMVMGPFHYLIALEMALLCALFSFLYRKGRHWFAGTVFLLGNSIVAPFPFYFLLGTNMYKGLVPYLFIASLLNTVFALVIIPRLSRVLASKKGAGDERCTDCSV